MGNLYNGQGLCGLRGPLQNAGQWALLRNKEKNTMKYNVIDTNYKIKELVCIVGDQTIHLSGYVSEKKYSKDFRLVKWKHGTGTACNCKYLPKSLGYRDVL